MRLWERTIETESPTLHIEREMGLLPGHPDIQRIWSEQASIGQLLHPDGFVEYHFDIDRTGRRQFVISGLGVDLIGAPSVAEEFMEGINEEAQRTGCAVIRAEFSLESEGEEIFRWYLDHGFVPVPGIDGMIKTVQPLEIAHTA